MLFCRIWGICCPKQRIKFLHVLQFSIQAILWLYRARNIFSCWKETLPAKSIISLLWGFRRAVCVSYRDRYMEEGVKQRSGGRAVGETAPKTPSGGISRMGSLSCFLLVALSAQILSIIRSLGVWRSQGTKIWLLVLWEIHHSKLFLFLS